jgi:hypothetical protein
MRCCSGLPWSGCRRAAGTGRRSWVEARIVFREPDKFSLSIKDSPDVPMLFKRVN